LGLLKRELKAGAGLCRAGRVIEEMLVNRGAILAPLMIAC